MKTRHRKKKGVLNVTGLPPYPIQRSKPLIRSDIIRAHTKLKHLIDLEQYDDAQFLFTELIKTSRYNIHNFWKVGAEIIGKTSPNQLADYLRAVFINSPNPLSLVTFDAYIDQLMLERKWANALEEIDLLFNRPQYHHPILLRKKAICCYQQWLEAKSALPESYLEEEVYDEYDTNIIRYERCVKTTSKNMAEAYQVYFRDVELLNMYFEFLKETKDEEAIQSAVAKSLESFNKNPDFYLLK
ncbi:uncharacterized protein B0P05DRAFT_182403 [Gilbertella persicaria]|uniref:uncharacterized protein n=1 Tax=Gilbertella persicaria TaxID=101096 RepID=UPI0022209EEE|nr:uncharacterized protein B0P05DRAFT_182403 [Gilbertella persicaria]KAI8070526.1 hypothetical protein B0P05DRAFT_182403 [Gilbertella persicaria]